MIFWPCFFSLSFALIFRTSKRPRPVWPHENRLPTPGSQSALRHVRHARHAQARYVQQLTFFVYSNDPVLAACPLPDHVDTRASSPHDGGPPKSKHGPSRNGNQSESPSTYRSYGGPHTRHSRRIIYVNIKISRFQLRHNLFYNSSTESVTISCTSQPRKNVTLFYATLAQKTSPSLI